MRKPNDKDRTSRKKAILPLVFGILFCLPYLAFPADTETQPALAAGNIRIGDLQRTYRFYAPPNRKANASLMLVFHGAGGDAMRIRMISGHQWESLAEQHNFVVVYPEGIQKHWNDCRKMPPYPAKLKNIDDVGFVKTLVEKFREHYHIASTNVFAAGLSNGGQMVYRLALEAPGLFRAIAAIGANLPAKDNDDCSHSMKPISVMILTGKEDTINPFDGGDVKLPDGTHLGAVVSAEETADYFRRLAGYQEEPTSYRYPERDSLKETSVERISWNDDSRPEVSLYAVTGGGHNIPQSIFRAPEIYGRTVTEINGPEEIWKFFERQLKK